MLLPSRVAGRTLGLRGPDLARGPEVARLWPKRRLTWSPKRVDSTNQKRLPANAHAHRDVFQTHLPWQDMAKLNRGSIFVIAETQFAIQSQVL